jgi:hypothetical protein
VVGPFHHDVCEVVQTDRSTRSEFRGSGAPPFPCFSGIVGVSGTGGINAKQALGDDKVPCVLDGGRRGVVVVVPALAVRAEAVRVLHAQAKALRWLH